MQNRRDWGNESLMFNWDSLFSYLTGDISKAWWVSIVQDSRDCAQEWSNLSYSSYIYVKNKSKKLAQALSSGSTSTQFRQLTKYSSAEYELASLEILLRIHLARNESSGLGFPTTLSPRFWISNNFFDVVPELHFERNVTHSQDSRVQITICTTNVVWDKKLSMITKWILNFICI